MLFAPLLSSWTPSRAVDAAGGTGGDSERALAGAVADTASTAGGVKKASGDVGAGTQAAAATAAHTAAAGDSQRAREVIAAVAPCA